MLDGVHEVHLNAGDWILAEDGAFQSIPHQMFVKPSNTTLRLILSFNAGERVTQLQAFSLLSQLQAF